MAREDLSKVILAVLILTLGGCGSEGPSSSGGEGNTPGETTPTETASRTVNLTPSRGSGVSGTAIFTDIDGGVEVKLDVQNLIEQPATEHPAHIHNPARGVSAGRPNTGGTCADDRAGNGAPIEYSLNPVITRQDNTGSSTTVVPGVTVDQLFSGPPKYVNVHATAEGNETPPGISCADLVVPTGDSTTGQR